MVLLVSPAFKESQANKAFEELPGLKELKESPANKEFEASLALLLLLEYKVSLAPKAFKG